MNFYEIVAIVWICVVGGVIIYSVVHYICSDKDEDDYNDIL
jgi:hypothetical protein